MKEDLFEEKSDFVLEKIMDMVANDGRLSLSAIPIIAEALRQVAREVYEECAKIATETKFKRSCSDHDSDSDPNEEHEVVWTFNGSREIPQAIRDKAKELK